MKSLKPGSNLAVLTPLLLAALASGCSKPETLHIEKELLLPADINTVTGGLPFALKIRDDILPGAHVTWVGIEFSRGDQLNLSQITYAFQPLTNGRQLIVGLAPNSRRAFGYYGQKVNPSAMSPDPGALDTANIQKDLWDVVEIAKTNKLTSSSLLGSGNVTSYMLELENSNNAPVWHVAGHSIGTDATTNRFVTRIDARTGAILPEPLN
jgi:hypothetical protein